MAIEKAIAKWTREEDLRLYQMHKALKRGDKKDHKLQQLSNEFGRTVQATIRHYYHLLKYNVFEVFDNDASVQEMLKQSQEVVQLEETLPKEEEVNSLLNERYQIFWTDQRLDMLKNAIKRRIREQTSYKKMIARLADKFSFSHSTVENKIKDLQREVNIYDWEELAKKIEKKEVKSTAFIRVYNKRKKKNKKVVNFPTNNQQEQVFEMQEPIEEISLLDEVQMFEEVPIQATSSEQEITQAEVHEMVEEVVVEQEPTQEKAQEMIIEKKQSLFSVLKNAYLNYKISKMEKRITQLKNKIQ